MSEFTTKGFHHVTMVTKDARRNAAFYHDVLGLTLVKKTVNFDLPDTYHLYFGDPAASPGTLLTFFEWPHAKRGNWGIGGVHHVALGVPDQETLLKWKRWLVDHGVRVTGPYNRGYFMSIYFQDPDGQVLEIATEGPGFDIDEPMEALGQQVVQPKYEQLPGGRNEEEIRQLMHPESIEWLDETMALSGIHHVTGMTDDLDAANEFYEKALGLRRIKMTVNQDDPDTPHHFWANYDGSRILPGSDMTLFGWPPTARRAREGVGQTHHVAFRADDDDQLNAWREYLLGLGLKVTEVRDRKYFKSIYFTSSDGLLHEIATDGPGFAVDEDPDRLGQELKLPEWLEPRRAEITAKLAPIELVGARG